VKGTTEAIFVVTEIQDKYRDKGKKSSAVLSQTLKKHLHA